MLGSTLMRLAQDLEWLGCELEHYGKKHADAGFPEAGPNWESFLEKQQGVLVTADKLVRELKTAVTFNPEKLVRVEYPIDAALDAVTALIGALEEIKHSAVFSVHDLPPKVRAFSRLVETYLSTVGAPTR
jgi:hypothetical protein